MSGALEFRVLVDSRDRVAMAAALIRRLEDTVHEYEVNADIEDKDVCADAALLALLEYSAKTNWAVDPAGAVLTMDVAGDLNSEDDFRDVYLGLHKYRQGGIGYPLFVLASQQDKHRLFYGELSKEGTRLYTELTNKPLDTEGMRQYADGVIEATKEKIGHYEIARSKV